jgi:hypothetical protein
VQVALDPEAGLAVADRFEATTREHGGDVHQVFGSRADALTWLGRPAEAVAAVEVGLAAQVEAASLKGADEAVAEARACGPAFLDHARQAIRRGTARYVPTRCVMPWMSSIAGPGSTWGPAVPDGPRSTGPAGPPPLPGR